MLLLALDASTPTVTVALARAEDPAPDSGREVLAEVSVSGNASGVRGASGASEVLLSAVDSVLSFSGASMEDVERILVGVGPGTFTGIRIAAATARALSFGTGIPLSRGSALDALAAPTLSLVRGDNPGRDVLAVLDARRREVFVRRYAAGDASSRAGGETRSVRPEELSGLSEWSAGEPLLVGDGAVRYREVLGKLGYIPPDGSPLHRVAASGHVLSADLTVVAAEDLTPLYVREPDAEVRRESNPWSRS